MIASDLDGTLLSKGTTLLPKNAKALQRATDAGIAVVIASGRLPGVCSRIAMDMGLPGCRIIGLNGTQVWESPFGRETFCSVFPEKTARACWEICDRAKAPVTLYVPNGIYTNQRFQTEDSTLRYQSHFARSNVQVVIAPDAVERGLLANPLKFLVKFPLGNAQEKAVRAELAALPGIGLTTSKRETLEIMQAGLSKARALAHLAKSLGIFPQEVMAFGDFDNDVEMLAWAGLGIAMGNAAPEVKRVAKHVTATNEESGVALAVHAYLDGALGP